MSKRFYQILLLTLFLSIPFLSGSSCAKSPTPSATDFKAQDPLNYFSYNLYKNLPQNENLVLSPFSIHSVLSMTFAGATGANRDEGLTTLGFGKATNEQIYGYYGEISKTLSDWSSAEGIELLNANSIWVNCNVKKQFLKDSKKYFASEVKRGVKPEAINRWVSEKTRAKIENIIPEDMDPDAVSLVLVNALYFNGTWREPFKDSDTYDDNFTLSDGTKIKVPMMHQKRYFQYFENKDFQAISIPYRSPELVMNIYLPKKKELLKSNSSGYVAIRKALYEADAQNVELSLPKFKASYRISLKPILTKMGMNIAFKNGGFDLIADSLYISDVIHKAVIEVAERGTEAAAVTAVMLKCTSMMPPEKTIEMNVDHPFLFEIRGEAPNSPILFSGLIQNPKK